MDAFYDSIAIPILAAIAGAVIAVLLGSLMRGGEPRSLLMPAIGGAILFVTLWLGYTALDYVANAQHWAERRALDDRHAAMSQQTSETGSMLACLNGLPGEAVESACAGAVFATPQTVAAAVAHAAARLALLADSLAYARRFDPKYEQAVADLRRAAENDAFGLYAHVLAVRDGCTAERCAAFALLQEPGLVKVHLQQQIYEHRVAENSLRWLQPVATAPQAGGPQGVPQLTAPQATAPQAIAPQAVAPAAQLTSPVAAAPAITASAPPSHGNVPPVASVLPNIDFPSSASIPPVSIMSAEPRATTATAEDQQVDPSMPGTPASAPIPVPIPLPRSAPRPPPQ